MKSPRPSFEKKELAFSSAPFAYIPGDFPVYTVEVTHRDPVDGELLQRALNRTLQRMPYLSDTLVIDYSDKKITPKSLMECPSLRYFSQKPFGVIFLYIMLPKAAKLLIA